MPLYDYKCPVCSRKREVLLALANLQSLVSCPKCGNAMNRLVSAPYVVNDYAPYDCPITGKIIEGRRQHEENLKLHGCRVLEPGESENHRKSLAKDEERFDKALEDTFEETISSWDTSKRERLAAEMEAGVTAEVVRN